MGILHILHFHPSEVVKVRSAVVGAASDRRGELQHRMRCRMVSVGHYLHLTHFCVSREADRCLLKLQIINAVQSRDIIFGSDSISLYD